MTEQIVVRAYNRYTLFASGEGYKICRMEFVKIPPGEKKKNFIAKGTGIPEQRDCIIVLSGNWVTKGTDRYFAVSSFDTELPTSEEGVVSYLSSLHCGVGKKTATNLYKKYKENLWSIIDNQPDLLIKDNLLGRSNTKRLLKALEETRMQSKVMQKFKGSGITMRKANALCKEFGAETLNIIETHPYQLCKVSGFSFNMVDAIALGSGIDPTNIERREAAAVAALDSAAQEGDVCLPRNLVVDKMMRLLHNTATREMCESAISNAIADKLIANTSGFLYTRERFAEEKRICSEIFRLKSSAREPVPMDALTQIIQNYENENNIRLADSQKEAIKTCLSSAVSIITGGPGTGKSTVIKAVLYCFKAIDEENFAPVLMSPTGKAARRMTEATQYPASTIHSAIGFTGEETPSALEKTKEEDMLTGGSLFIIDESSMMDQFITCHLLRRIPEGASVIFVGDPDQLPSVGCGNVLNELIRSQVIPTTKLSVIFRQKQGNPIVENAARILAGRTDLLYEPRFVHMDLDDSRLIGQRACNMYVQAARKYGLDNVVLLCPYRKTGELNVNIFNLSLQAVLNPMKPNQLSIKGKTVFTDNRKSIPMEFRAGDKIMMTVNKEWAKNGDTGYIRAIRKAQDPETPGSFNLVADVEFNDDGHVFTISRDDVQDLDLAYCTSVHKSQGSEYKVVIMVMCNEHSAMLKRNLFYTAITRAKEFVLLIGETSAITNAILDTHTKQRYTLLADRLHGMQQRRMAIPSSRNKN